MKPLTLEWIAKAERDWVSAARELRVRRDPNYDGVCFFAQQCAEKYLKAALGEMGQTPAWIHDLKLLLAELLPSYPLWAALHQPAVKLTGYAVRFRYPGNDADKVMAKEAVALCRLIRNMVRQQFGLPTAPTPSKRRRRVTVKKAARKRSAARKPSTQTRVRKKH